MHTMDHYNLEFHHSSQQMNNKYFRYMPFHRNLVHIALLEEHMHFQPNFLVAEVVVEQRILVQVVEVDVAMIVVEEDVAEKAVAEIEGGRLRGRMLVP